MAVGGLARGVPACAGSNDPATYQLLERSAREPGHRGSALRCGSSATGASPVTILQGGWAIDLPGSFSDERTPEDRWSGSDAGRTVTLAGAADGDRRPADVRGDLPRGVRGDLGEDALEHQDGPRPGPGPDHLGREHRASRSATARGLQRACRGSGAVLRIEFENPGDWKWALDTWRALRPACS